MNGDEITGGSGQEIASAGESERAFLTNLRTYVYSRDDPRRRLLTQGRKERLCLSPASPFPLRFLVTVLLGWLPLSMGTLSFYLMVTGKMRLERQEELGPWTRMLLNTLYGGLSLFFAFIGLMILKTRYGRNVVKTIELDRIGLIYTFSDGAKRAVGPLSAINGVVLYPTEESGRWLGVRYEGNKMSPSIFLGESDAALIASDLAEFLHVPIVYGTGSPQD